MELIDDDGTKIKFSSKYRIPDHDDWWGVFPRYGGFGQLHRSGQYQQSISFNDLSLNPIAPINEEVKVGVGTDPRTALMQYYKAQWNQVRKVQGVQGREAVITAIRLQGQGTTPDGKLLCDLSELEMSFYKEPLHIYPAALNNRLRCAYRYKVAYGPTVTRGGDVAMTIEVVHLGDAEVHGKKKTADYPAELVNATLADIDKDSWWSAREAEGKVIRRTFYKSPWKLPTVATPNYNGAWISHWSRSRLQRQEGDLLGPIEGLRVRANYASDSGNNQGVMNGSNISVRNMMLTVRPFLKNPPTSK